MAVRADVDQPFLFVPVTIGLAFLVATRFFGTLLVINVAIRVVTGLVQEFEFGMNWSAYSRLVGNVFGAPLAMEGLAAFFLESTFLGLWIFGWDKLSRRVHLLTIWLVFAGTILSAAFILAANSWMQHPVGYNDHTPTQIFSIPHLIFSELYPRLMVSSTSSAFNLTIRNSASPSYQPKVMTVVALVLLPIVIAYTAWTYYVFRRRISDKDFVTAMKEENAHDHVH